MVEAFDNRKIFKVALIALSVTFIFTSFYSLAPVSCVGIGCSPELSVGRFHFTTPMLILLIVQIVGILGLIIALIITRRSKPQNDAFASLASSSPIFNVQKTNIDSPTI